MGTNTNTNAVDDHPKRDKAKKIINDICQLMVLVLSILLIVYISYDTFMNVSYLENHRYMTFQFWVCIVFLAVYFIELGISDHPWRYARRNILFFLISIPYLNIIHQLNLNLSDNLIYYLRFVPLGRGAYSLAMVLRFISRNRATSLLFQYSAVLLSTVYILALIFFYEENKINPNVNDFWDALYWAAMNTVTVGCNYAAVTPIGKIISVILPIGGMLMLPLFTVYITNWIQNINSQKKQ